MTKDADHGITELLLRWNEGDPLALDELIPQVIDDLRRVASIYLSGEGPGHTLQPTALINELYLRLADQGELRWQDRGHFFSFAARAMRRILIDHARAKKTAKRGGEVRLVGLSEAWASADSPKLDVLALHEALEALSALDERQGKIVELRTFAGLGLRETAEVLGISVATVSREWASAKAWLYDAMRSRR